MSDLFDTICALKGKRRGGTIEEWKLQYVGDPIVGTGEICFGRCVDDDWHGNSTGGFRTSEVIHHDKENHILETRNTLYMLGEPAKPPPILTAEEQKIKDQEMADAVELLRHFIV